MTFRLLYLFLLVLPALPSIAQEGYEIRLEIAGLSDTTAHLGYYINENTFILDTAEVNGAGECVFSGRKSLREGVYMFVLKTTRHFEFLVGADQQFTLATDIKSPVESMKVSGDQDNELFFKSIFFNIRSNHEAEPFGKILRDSAQNDRAKANARDELNRISRKVMEFQNSLVDKNPGTLAGRILRAQRPVEIPDPPKNDDGSVDPGFQLRWYREHYFDHFDLADDALLRLSKPLYRDKVYEYLDKLYAQHPDSLMPAITQVVEKAKGNPETYKYVVFLCMLKYQNPEIMGLDQLYVNLYDKYFVSGEMDFWASEAVKKSIGEVANRYRKSLIGDQGDNLIMLDADLQPRSLYDLKNQYVVIYYFDPDCYGCKRETPKLVDFYNDTKFDIEVFAVCADSSMTSMRKYISEMNMKWVTVNGPRTYVGPIHDHYDVIQTPTLYVLDEKRKIIAKNVPIEKLEEFLKHHERLANLEDK